MKRHFTVTTYIIDEEKVLFIFHNKFQKWMPPGGHLEEDELPPEGAKREVMEETGADIDFILQENIWIDEANAKSFPRPYVCLVENIPAYSDQPPHQHLDLIYAAKPKGNALLEDEVAAGRLKWFSLQEAEKLADEGLIFPDALKILKHLFDQTKAHAISQTHETTP